MDKIYLESIKGKQSKTPTEKYKVITCQETVTKNYDTTQWISLQDIIKKTKDLKIFKGLLLSKYTIIIKIGKSETIEREYNISHLLSNIPNFITYLCFFTCANNINTIVTNSSICAKEGDILKILVMKEYPLGDIKYYNWNKENFHILKSLIKQILVSLFIAYQLYGFIHNDVHFGNFLIKNDSAKNKIINYPTLNISIETFGYMAIIMDFENSLFDESKTNYDFLYKMFEQIICGIDWYLDIKTNNIEQIKEYLTLHIKTKKIIDIKYMLDLIDIISFNERNDKTKLFKYNPLYIS